MRLFIFRAGECAWLQQTHTVKASSAEFVYSIVRLLLPQFHTLPNLFTPLPLPPFSPHPSA